MSSSEAYRKSLLASNGGTMIDGVLSPEEEVAALVSGSNNEIAGTTIRNDAQTRQNRLFELKESILTGNASADDQLEFHDLLLDMSSGTTEGTALAEALASRPDLRGTAVSGPLTNAAYNSVRQQDPELAAIFSQSLSMSTNSEHSRQFSVTRDDRTITFNIRNDATDLATGVVPGADGSIGNYSVDSALAQVHPDAYKSLVNAAFDTNVITALEISGGFRPEGSISGQSSVHPGDRGLDLSSITYNTNGGSAVASLSAPNQSGAPGSVQPDIVSSFSNNLLSQGAVTQVLQPWQMSSGSVFEDNLGISSVERGHRDHLHFTVNRNLNFR